MSDPTSSGTLLVRNDARFIDLARTFTAEEWARPSLCSGWSNLDVLAHLVVGSSASLASVGIAIAACGGSFDRANTAMTKALAKTHGAPALLDHYEQLGRQRKGIGRLFPKNLMLGDHVLHELDIVLALERRPTVDSEVLAAVLDTEVSVSNPFVPAKRTAKGLELTAPDVSWRHAAHDKDAAGVTGPAWALASVLANRPAAIAHLEGKGVEILVGRLKHNARDNA